MPAVVLTRPAFLLLRSRSGAALTGALIVYLLLVGVVPSGLVEVPMRGQVSNQLLPLVACLPGLALTVSLYSSSWEMECASARSMIVVRACSLLVVETVELAVVVIAQTPSSYFSAIALRNHLLITGIALFCGVLLPRTVAWAIPTGYVGATWLYGTIDLSGRPRPWALIMRDPAEQLPWVLAIACAVLGAVLWIWRDGAHTAAI